MGSPKMCAVSLAISTARNFILHSTTTLPVQPLGGAWNVTPLHFTLISHAPVINKSTKQEKKKTPTLDQYLFFWKKKGELHYKRQINLTISEYFCDKWNNWFRRLAIVYTNSSYETTNTSIYCFQSFRCSIR